MPFVMDLNFFLIFIFRDLNYIFYQVLSVFYVLLCPQLNSMKYIAMRYG